MNLEKLADLGRNFVGGIILSMALTASQYASPARVYSQEPPAKPDIADKLKESDPMRSIGVCLCYTSQKSLEVIGAQGGYGKTKPEVKQDIKEAFIPYYYDKGKFLMPETKTIEKELSDYVDSTFLKVLEIDGKVKFIPGDSKIKTETTIKKGAVDFKYDISLKVSKDNMMETTFSMSPKPISVPSKLYEMLEIAKFITDSHKKNPDMICISDLTNMAEERNLRVQSLEFNDLPNCIFYKITKSKEGESSIELGPLSSKSKEKEEIKKDNTGEPETFQFFNRYDPKENQGIPKAPASRE